MPFLCAPLRCSNDFYTDVKKYIANTNLLEYRKKYIEEHYNETEIYLKNIAIISAVPVVSYYIKNYFPNLNCYKQSPTIFNYSKIHNINTKKVIKKYDFVYMARIEKGKGLEYLDLILTKIFKILKRRIKIAILGERVDSYSDLKLKQLLNNSCKSNSYCVEYFGWADSKLKYEILSVSSVFLYPSHYDTFGLVIYEALSCGLPVIVWDILFTKKSFNKIDSVIRTRFKDFDSFANNAVYALKNFSYFSKKSKDFVKNIPDINEIYNEDCKIFLEIIKNYNDRNK